MDYIRIYEAFIKDRRAKEPTLTGYTERHHILPKCLGGGNEPENLIRLTPEDHYFAHLLLAQIHGGKLWIAVHAMCNLSTKFNRPHRGRLHARFNFGHVRRQCAKYFSDNHSGMDNASADKAVYTFHHFDGREATGNRFDIEAKTGVPGKQISALLRGAKKSAHGWYSELTNPDGLTKIELIQLKVRDSSIHTLHHHDGREWSGTLFEFDEMAGGKLWWREGQKHICGWYKTKEEAALHEENIAAKARRRAAKRGSISGASNPRADDTVYDFYNHRTNERRQCTRYDLCVSNGIGYGDISAVFSGKQQSAKGWTLWDRRNEKFKRAASPIVLEKDGEIIRGTRAEIAARFGLASEKISYGIYSLRVGKCQTYKGWKLVEEEASDARAA